MARHFRTAPWALIGVVIVALWAWSTQVTTPSLPDRSPSAPSAETTEPRRAGADVESAGRTVDPRAASSDDTSARGPSPVAPAWLPPEARDTLRLIARGGPFPYRQDGGTFGNRERRLPAQPRGWYREYTVDTPGSPDRGARRIIAGGDPPTELYYTDNHYRSFRRIPVMEDTP